MYELVYCSLASRTLVSEDIVEILTTAREFNLKNNITGCLLYYNHEFIQILEGEQDIIQNLFSKIDQDNRHSNMLVVAEGEKEQRVFTDWSMAFLELTNDDVRHLDKEVFEDNLISFSRFAEKRTFPTILFWSKVCLLLKK